MNKKHDDFRDEARDEAAQMRTQPEPQDPASMQAMQMLQTYYQIDHEDRQSVQRAWDRLIREAGWREQSTLFLPLSGSQRSAQSGGSVTWRRPITIRAALLVAALLVVSMIPMLLLIKLKGSQTANPRTATAQQTSVQARLLGKNLGMITLGMTLDEVLRLMQPATPEREESADGAMVDLTYSEAGVQFTFNLSTTPQEQQTVQDIMAWSPYEKTTAEGFGLQMSYDAFSRLYGNFKMNRTNLQNTKLPFPLFAKGVDKVASVTDVQGTTLWALFNKELNAIQLILQVHMKPVMHRSQ